MAIKSIDDKTDGSLNKNKKFTTLEEECTKIADSIRGGYIDNKIEPINFAERIDNIERRNMVNKSYEVPCFYNGTAGLMVDKIAASYYNARVLDGENFKYSANRGPFSDGYRYYATICKDIGDTSEKKPKEDEKRKAYLIDCSTFIGLILRGIDFSHSPYYEYNLEGKKRTGPDTDTIHEIFDDPYAQDPPEVKWVTSNIKNKYGNFGLGNILDKQPINSFTDFDIPGYSSIRTAASLAYFLMANGSYVVFDSNRDGISNNKTYQKTQPGDIIFWAKPGASANQKLRYRSISHVGIVAHDRRRLYEVTGFESYRVKGKTVFYARWTDSATEFGPIIYQKDENNNEIFDRDGYSLPSYNEDGSIKRGKLSESCTKKYDYIALILRPKYKTGDYREENLLYNPYVTSTQKMYGYDVDHSSSGTTNSSNADEDDDNNTSGDTKDDETSNVITEKVNESNTTFKEFATFTKPSSEAIQIKFNCDLEGTEAEIETNLSYFTLRRRLRLEKDKKYFFRFDIDPDSIGEFPRINYPVILEMTKYSSNSNEQNGVNFSGEINYINSNNTETSIQNQIITLDPMADVFIKPTQTVLVNIHFRIKKNNGSYLPYSSIKDIANINSSNGQGFILYPKLYNTTQEKETIYTDKFSNGNAGYYIENLIGEYLYKYNDSKISCSNASTTKYDEFSTNKEKYLNEKILIDIIFRCLHYQNSPFSDNDDVKNYDTTDFARIYNNYKEQITSLDKIANFLLNNGAYVVKDKYTSSFSYDDVEPGDIIFYIDNNGIITKAAFCSYNKGFTYKIPNNSFNYNERTIYDEKEICFILRPPYKKWGIPTTDFNLLQYPYSSIRNLDSSDNQDYIRVTVGNDNTVTINRPRTTSNQWGIKGTKDHFNTDHFILYPGTYQKKGNSDFSIVKEDAVKIPRDSEDIYTITEKTKCRIRTEDYTNNKSSYNVGLICTKDNT